MKLANRLIMGLNRAGLTIGTQHVLSIRGRKSGKPRSTPVSVVTVGGRRYVCTGWETDWVKNARAAGRGLLSRGRRTEPVALVELSLEERRPILREFPLQVPDGVRYFVMIGAVEPPADSQAFADAADRLIVFRLDPLP